MNTRYLAIISQTTALIAILFSSTIENQPLHGFASQQPITGTLCGRIRLNLGHVSL